MAKQEQKKPYILVIMADDIGIWNISAYHRGMMGGRVVRKKRDEEQGACRVASDQDGIIQGTICRPCRR
jgi:arylsulfatase A-like enzyme